MATILVGDGQTTFNVHAELLSANSCVLNGEIGNADSKNEIKPLIIRNVTAEVFDIFVTWIYAKNHSVDGVVVPEIEEDDTDNEDVPTPAAEPRIEREVTPHANLRAIRH